MTVPRPLGALGPVGQLGCRDFRPLAIGGDGSGMGGLLGADLGKRLLRRFGDLAQVCDRRARTLRIGQRGHCRFRVGKRLRRIGAVGLQLAGPFGETGAAKRQSLDLDAGLILGPLRLANRRDSLGLGPPRRLARRPRPLGGGLRGFAALLRGGEL